MLEIQTRLLTIDRQTKRVHKLETRIVPIEQLASMKFVINSKTHLVAKVLLFIANYKRELRIEVDIRRKGKIEKITEFVKRMKRIQEKAEVVLKKVQEEIKWQVDRERKEV